MTADALAAEFEVSVRTIYRDIDQLSAAGVPIYGDRGPNGGFDLLEGYRTHLTGLTFQEAEALFLAGIPDAASQLGLGGALADAQLKLLNALPATWAPNVGNAARYFHLDPLPWYRRNGTPPHLRSLADAVWAGRRIHVHYVGWKGPVARVLEPLGLILKAGEWYLVAQAGGQKRTYKVHNIQELAILTEPFARPGDFDLAAHWAAETRRFELGLVSGTALVRFSPSAIRHLDSLGSDMKDAVMAAVPDASGWREAHIPIESPEAMARQLLPLGRHVEVIGPEHLRSTMCVLAAELSRLYGSARDEGFSRGEHATSAASVPADGHRLTASRRGNQ
jgi:predicted DNA-binding transcriptional regulator YafY